MGIGVLDAGREIMKTRGWITPVKEVTVSLTRALYLFPIRRFWCVLWGHAAYCPDGYWESPNESIPASTYLACQRCGLEEEENENLS